MHTPLVQYGSNRDRISANVQLISGKAGIGKYDTVDPSGGPVVSGVDRARHRLENCNERRAGWRKRVLAPVGHAHWP